MNKDFNNIHYKQILYSFVSSAVKVLNPKQNFNTLHFPHLTYLRKSSSAFF